jgi:hypothetical protein
MHLFKQEIADNAKYFCVILYNHSFNAKLFGEKLSNCYWLKEIKVGTKLAKLMW